MKAVVLSMLPALTFGGCGVVGSPVAPESVGVNVKRQQDQAQRERRGKEPAQEVPEGAERSPASAADVQQPETMPQDYVNPSARPQADIFIRPR